jgi:hypothetical protein
MHLIIDSACLSLYLATAFPNDSCSGYMRACVSEVPDQCMSLDQSPVCSQLTGDLRCETSMTTRGVKAGNAVASQPVPANRPHCRLRCVTHQLCILPLCCLLCSHLGSGDARTQAASGQMHFNVNCALLQCSCVLLHSSCLQPWGQDAVAAAAPPIPALPPLPPLHVLRNLPAPEAQAVHPGITRHTICTRQKHAVTA